MDLHVSVSNCSVRFKPLAMLYRSSTKVHHLLSGVFIDASSCLLGKLDGSCLDWVLTSLNSLQIRITVYSYADLISREFTATTLLDFLYVY